MKKTITLLITPIFLIIIFSLLATNIVGKNMGETFNLPENSRKLSSNLYYLGRSTDINGKQVEGYAFIRRRDPQAKPPWAGGGNKNGVPVCYGYLADGAKWKNTEAWIVNASNSGLSESFLLENLDYNIDKWETAAQNFSIIGSGSSTTNNLVADTQSPDGQNEVYFADIFDSDAIAVTIVWGYFTGRPAWRELVEWDQVYDNVDYGWSNNGASGKMDFENISTHELGHTVGMDDIYDSSCADVTMFGYANFGETNKSTLEQPDIDGVRALYQ